MLLPDQLLNPVILFTVFGGIIMLLGMLGFVLFMTVFDIRPKTTTSSTVVEKEQPRPTTQRQQQLRGQLTTS